MCTKCHCTRWTKTTLNMTSPEHRNRHVANNVDQLAFKYMELCKVESSTDSESEISPRWSDTSAMGCVSSTPEKRTFTRTLPLTHKPVGRHGCYSLFLDPYDGSSEDSDESKDVGSSSRQTRQQGKVGGGGGESGSRLAGRNRRFILHHPASVAMTEVAKNVMREPATQQQPQQQHLLDVQMKCGSDSELCVLDVISSHGERDYCRNLANDATMHSQTIDTEMHCQVNDSGLHRTKPSTSYLPGAPVERSLSQRLDSSSGTSPCPSNPRSVYKRKLGFPEEERAELWQRKRQCVVNMDEQKRK